MASKDSAKWEIRQVPDGPTYEAKDADDDDAKKKAKLREALIQAQVVNLMGLA